MVITYLLMYFGVTWREGVLILPSSDIGSEMNRVFWLGQQPLYGRRTTYISEFLRVCLCNTPILTPGNGDP